MGPLALAGGAMALGGGVMSGIGSYMSGQMQGATADFNASQLMLDAQIMESNADESARRLRLAGRKLEGRQRTMIAKSGFRLEGTPLEVMAESAKNIELDAIRVRQEGRFQGKQARVQATWQRKMADHYRRAGTIGAIAGVLGGGAGAAKIWAT